MRNNTYVKIKSEDTADKFKRVVSTFLKARYPYLYISTWEEERVLRLVREVVKDVGLIRTCRKLFVWSLTEGMVEDEQHGSRESNAFKALEFLENYREPAVFILKDFHIFLGAQNRGIDTFRIIRKLRDITPNLIRSANPKNVVFISPSLVLPSDLEKDVTIVDFDLPSSEEIEQKLEEIINEQGGRIAVKLDKEEKERLARAAMGLTLQEAENSFARAMVEKGRLDVQSVELILEEKRQIIKKMEILEFIPSNYKMDDDVGGLENLKRWLRKRNKSWIDSAIKRYGLESPKGVLIAGVPGCGKSLIAKAISAMWQLPLLRLDVGRIFSGLVGSSEENMRRAIKTAEAIAPSILWIDEIEKGFSTGDARGDSGTSMRVFSTFLTWMQEKTKSVFVVATANNIHALPPEMLRKGRFDEIFFVDLPTRQERLEILKLHINKRAKDPTVIKDFDLTNEKLVWMADRTEGFIGAELEQLVVSALFEAFSENRSLSIDDFAKAIKNTVPLSKTQAEQIQDIREWANERAVSATPREYLSEYPLTAKHESEVGATRGGRIIDC